MKGLLCALAAAVLLPGLGCSTSSPPKSAPAAPAAAKPPTTMPVASTTVIDMQMIAPERASIYFGQTFQKGEGTISFLSRLGEIKAKVKDDSLLVDTNGDGKLDDADQSLKTNGTIPVSIQIGDRKGQITLMLENLQKQGDDTMAVIGFGGAMEGTFNGSKVRASFYSLLPDGTPDFQSVQVIPTGNDANSAQRMPWSKTIAFTDRLYQVDVQDKGWKLALKPYTGPIALVKLQITPPAKACEATFASTSGVQTAQVTAKEFTRFVPGKYTLSNAHLSIPKANGQHDCTSGQSAKDSQPFEFKQGENLITLGGPFKFDFTAYRTGDTLLIADVWAAGASQERYSPSATNKDGQLFAAYIRSGQAEQELTKLEYG